MNDLVDNFLLYATQDPLMANGPAHHKRRANTALRMLKRYPEIARTNIHTAVVCGDLDNVRRILNERHEAATESGGPLRKRRDPTRDKPWTPLLYLCYGRLPLKAVAENSVAIAELLLDHGADPNDFFEVGDGPYRYTALCGVVGEGEDDAPPHAQRDLLAKLLLDRGAQPYDSQLLYNIHFHGEILWLMKLIYATSVARGQQSDWDDPLWSMLDIGLYGTGARYLLNIAVTKNKLDLAEWILSHGATPNTPAPTHPNLSKLSPYQEAFSRGFVEMAELLTRYGATTEQLVPSPLQEFSSACRLEDQVKLESLLKEHPELVKTHGPIFVACTLDRAEVVARLLDLGTPIEIEDDTKQRPLHVAAGHNSFKVTRLLIERGAQLDAVETNWQSTPLDQACYGDRTEMIQLLSSVSNDIFRVVWAGNKRRLLELLNSNPELAKASDEGTTPLMWLPDDESLSAGIAELLLDHGADPSVKNSEGMTAADIAERRALYATAELLRSRTRSE